MGSFIPVLAGTHVPGDGFKSKENAFDLDFPASNCESEGRSVGNGEFSDTTFKYIKRMVIEDEIEQMLMEDDDTEHMVLDPLALRAAEKSFYEVLGLKYPASPAHPTLCNPNNFSTDHNSGNSKITAPGESDFQSTSKMPLSSSECLTGSFDGITNPCSVSRVFFPNAFTAGVSVTLQFKNQVEEATASLPFKNYTIIDFENYKLLPMSKDSNPEEENNERKNHPGEDIERTDIEGRSDKQSMVCVDEDELSKMFDRVFLCPDDRRKPLVCTSDEVSQDRRGKLLKHNELPCGSNARKSGGKKRKNRNQVVDLRALLVLCARAIAIDERGTVDKLLTEIRQHSSPFGDGYQRFAHYFANGLEARLVGTGFQIYTASRMQSFAHMLKIYQTFISACPFKRISFYFASHHILNLAEKGTTLHIIDFGISYGFQWPIVIQDLSARPGGPPKLRITGIEFPKSGLQPEKTVEEAGHHLVKYCKRFNVSFEYNAVVKKWETIQMEDLKIGKNELIVVNCLYRLDYLLDETSVLDSPRNSVLSLIRNINPHIFIHGIINGSCNAPFFVTRFQEALFHYSSLFDMLDANITPENQERLMFEKEFYGQEVVNVLACEGSERVVRPLTYKYWQVQNMNAGFRQLPLDRELVKTLRAKVESHYHKDFVIDEDGPWMLQGWKGRILLATSCWIPAQRS
ncbi:scarecrow-like protein 14 [Malania oleifera]|uniref:scarecrow-like protein 14 n=1 Tax=Malania oleifera TaxID=397392 RepID=UPI0025AE3CA2|nr:scarecrow-like protein 14 [Malania oleifera]